jgi:hypothetical protein
MRGMGLVPVNPPKATSMVGCSPDSDDEYVVTRLTGDGKAQMDKLKEDGHGIDPQRNDGGPNHLEGHRRPDRQADSGRIEQTRRDQGNRSVSDISGNRRNDRKDGRNLDYQGPEYNRGNQMS